MLVALFPLASCTIWPILTVAVSSKSGNSDPFPILALFLLLPNGGGGSESANNTTPIVSTSTCETAGCALLLSSVTRGNLGGISGADTFCANDAFLQGAPGDPAGYKALIMTENGTRNLANSWVLYPNTVYRSLNNGNLQIATTDATNLVSGWIGISNAPNQEIDAGGSFSCDTFLLLYCVQR
ncbi:DUF1554 domain-containing protein [Leptospira sp. 201903071]|uniref:DUF1554 domain-containing protein n=1 Tax=Leptospira ainazelensis TaxID=2810034 RepID=UPI001964D233|nr:DUF1554 domain-containing protein [Leptospira ainazelensis]MBM9500019.1 DUF1554 domain-containing protein [Leptospira ainazelensis]